MEAGLIGLLSQTLDPNPNTRIQAELELAERLSNPESGLGLSSIFLHGDLDISLRQMSAVLALLNSKKFVLERWSPFFGSFRGSAPPVEAKSKIRAALFTGLSDPTSKIRSLSANVLSSIANCDWPDEYPDLLDSLISILSSGSPEAVHGAMKLFDEFIRSDLTEDQILPVLRQLLPIIKDIIISTKFTPSTRARAVAVFRQCVTALFMVKEQHPQAVREATNSVLPPWISLFLSVLNTDPEVECKESWTSLAIRLQIFKTFDALHTSFPRSLSDNISPLLALCLHHLQSLYPTFCSGHLQGNEVSSTSDPDDISLDLSDLASSIFSLVNSLSRGSRAKPWLESGNALPLATSICQWIQLTHEEEQEMLDNVNAFIAQDDEESEDYGFRSAGLDVLDTIFERLPFLTAQALQTTINSLMHDAESGRQSAQSDWWKPLEAALTALGSCAQTIIEYNAGESSAGKVTPIDTDYLLKSVVPATLTMPEHPFMQARGFVFASQFASVLSEEIGSQYVNAAISVLEASDSALPVKASAIKAIRNFCTGSGQGWLEPHVTRIVQDLGQFVVDATDEALILVLETLSLLLAIADGRWLTGAIASSIGVAMLNVWVKNVKDPVLHSILTDMFENLACAKVDGVYSALITDLLPSLAATLRDTPVDDSWISATAIDLINSLFAGASSGNLGNGVIGLVGPPLFETLAATKDRDVLQNGILCLTSIVKKNFRELSSWHDDKRRSGLHNVLSVIAKVLDPAHGEAGDLAVGDLIIHLLRNGGKDVSAVLPELLHAMIQRLPTAKTATFQQSLIIPISYLIHTHRDSMLSLLETSTLSDGASTLNTYVTAWCENAETFQGHWPIRTSALALCDMFLAERPALWEIPVKGDLIVESTNSDVIVTRSRAKNAPHRYTNIPFPVKILKLLLHDLQSATGQSIVDANGEDVVSDREDGEWSDEEDPNVGLHDDELAFLSDVLGAQGVKLDGQLDAELSEDEDFKDDPISHVDLQTHIISFFRDCATNHTNHFRRAAEMLTAEEQGKLQRVLS